MRTPKSSKDLALGLSHSGSAAHDEAGADSDVDVFVEFDGPSSFSRFMDLKLYLKDLLDCPVDLVTRRALKPRLRTRVEEEVVNVPGFQTFSG